MIAAFSRPTVAPLPSEIADGTRCSMSSAHTSMSRHRGLISNSSERWSPPERTLIFEVEKLSFGCANHFVPTDCRMSPCTLKRS